MAISPAKRPEHHSLVDIPSDRPSRHASRRRSSLSINDALKNIHLLASIDSKSKYYNLSMAQMIFLRRGAKWRPMLMKLAISLFFLVILS